MYSFARSILRSTCVLFASSLLFIALAVALISAVIAYNQKAPAPITPGTILVIDLSAHYPDSPSYEINLPSLLTKPNSFAQEIHLLKAVQAIKHAGKDSNIAGILIQGGPCHSGNSITNQLEILQALEVFKLNNKPIHAYLEESSAGSYALASISNHIYMNPQGIVQLNGLSFSSPFFGDALSRYGIGIQSIRLGKYKSALEPFTQKEMGKASKAQWDPILKSLWNSLIEPISKNRNIKTNTLYSITQNIGILNAKEALAHSLIDSIGYLDEALDSFKLENDTKAPNTISLQEYSNQKQDDSKNIPSIAVIYASGKVVNQRASSDEIGPKNILEQLQKARKDSQIKAIVLRINTPGGTPITADVIAHEIQLTRKEKPVYISMGSVAASAGYWISSPANYIFANNSTITGSIGVISLLPNVEEIMENHSVYTDGIKTAPYADIFSNMKPKTKEEMKLIKKFSKHIYDLFIDEVAKGRNLSKQEVRKIAQGRAWPSGEALKHQLIDAIGTLQDTIAYAAQDNDILNNYKIVEYNAASNILEALSLNYKNRFKSKVHAFLSGPSSLQSMCSAEDDLLR